MNVSNPQTALKALAVPSINAIPFQPASLIPRGSVFTVIGQVGDWRLGFAGRISLTLRLSMGNLLLNANRDTLPLEIREGDWVRAKLMYRHDGQTRLWLSSAMRVAPAPAQTGWVPEALYHRHAAMVELRRLLSALEPELQSVFFALMLDRQVQRRYFWRPAASDHHCYPGGLFDQSVAAARRASQAECEDEGDRGLLTLASLLFDIGKTTDMRLLPDRTRCWPELQPPVATATRLRATLQRLASSRPGLSSDLSDLLAGDGPRTSQLTPRLVALRRQVRQHVQASWGLADLFVNTLDHTPGAAA